MKDNINFSKHQNSLPINGAKKINGIKNIDEIDGFTPFIFNNTINNTTSNTVDIFQTQNFSEFNNSSNFNNINIINNNNSFPSLININNINDIYDKNNLNQILFSKNQTFNGNSLNNNINNINNIINNSNKKINKVIFNNFNQENQYSNNITNINNINNFNNINIDNIIQAISSDFNNFNGQNQNENNNNFIFNEVNQITINNNTHSSSLIKELNGNNNQKNGKLNPSSSLFGRKNNKKKSKLFKNNQNGNISNEFIKEKDIRDFKRFCDGLKCPLPDYICSQIGSRIMQKYLNRFPPFIITNLIEKLYMNFEQIMCDIYGNYFCQKLYIISSVEQRRMILNSLKDIFISISKTSCGAHATQSIIEESSTKEEKLIIMEYVKGHEMELALHPEGTHVLQKIIQIFPEDERQSLTDVLCTDINVNILCQDIKGISVIKRIITFNTNEINKIKLVDSFFGNSLEISKSSSGSYIIQYLLEQWGVNIGLKLIYFCIANFESFAICKHSTNLIDKILLLCLKKYSIIRYFGNDQSMNSINNEIVIINALKNLILEPNRIINVYKNKYGKALLIKIRKLFSVEENKNFFLFIKSLETVPNYLESKKYKMYIEIFRAQ